MNELHGELAWKYRMHAASIENIWWSFGKNQRARCLKADAADGVLLKHSIDKSLGDIFKFVPDLNLRDITEPGSDFLGLLKYRATKSLFEQYCYGTNGGPGEHGFINEMMRTEGLHHAEPFKDCYTMFLDDEGYGKSYRVLSDHAETQAHFAPAILAGLCVPQSTGELILQRQINLLQCLNIMVEDILDESSQSRIRQERSKKSDKAASAALSKLNIRAPPAKLALRDLIASAHDQEASFEEYLSLLSIDPIVLAHAVNIWFFSQPELVADENGRLLLVYNDRYVSAAVFETINSVIKGADIRNYIGRLLGLLERSATNKV